MEAGKGDVAGEFQGAQGPADAVVFEVRGDDMVALGILRVKQLKDSGFKDAMLYDPQGVTPS